MKRKRKATKTRPTLRLHLTPRAPWSKKQKTAKARRSMGTASNIVVLPLLRHLHAPPAAEHPALFFQQKTAYEMPFGAMVCGDAGTAMAALPEASVHLIVTSP